MNSKGTAIILFKEQSGCSGREYAFLKYIDCTSPFVGVNKDLGYACPRCSTTTYMDRSTMEDDNRKFFVSEWFELEPLSPIRDVVYVVKSNYSLKSC